MIVEIVSDKPTNNILGIFKLILFIKKNTSTFFYLSIFALIYVGWKNRELSYLTPEVGAGYWLGIIGGSLMLLLLLYPLRKKVRFFNSFGPIKYWFKIHMFFGVIGPVAILFHANFSVASTNGSLALFSMIIVASSGFIGRYFYAKIHYGLYGRKANLKELRTTLTDSKSKMGHLLTITDDVAYKLKKSEKLLLRNRNIFFATLIWPIIFFRTEIAKRSIRKSLKKSFLKESKEKGWDKKMALAMSRDANAEVQPYLRGLYDVYGFRIFESLFSLWHILHLPLFIMLVITGIIHVIVVHSY